VVLIKDVLTRIAGASGGVAAACNTYKKQLQNLPGIFFRQSRRRAIRFRRGS
jgi:hypothetical protein